MLVARLMAWHNEAGERAYMISPHQANSVLVMCLSFRKGSPPFKELPSSLVTCTIILEGSYFVRKDASHTHGYNYQCMAGHANFSWTSDVRSVPGVNSLKAPSFEITDHCLAWHFNKTIVTSFLFFLQIFIFCKLQKIHGTGHIAEWLNTTPY